MMAESRIMSRCPACLALDTVRKTVRCVAPGGYYGNIVEFLECKSCGFLEAPLNEHEYGSASDFGQSSRPGSYNRRVGTENRPGREYYMGVLGWEILQRAELPRSSILVYGPGLSIDHLHLSRHFEEASVAVCDLENFQASDRFVSIQSAAQFDVVVACEVVEHFTKVEEDFRLLLSKLSHTGIAIISTNINDGSDLGAQGYPFVPGHTAYYTAASLRSIVQRIDEGYFVDFRTPAAALGQLGPRKRYVLIFRGEVWRGVADYFAAQPLAPSELSYQRLGIVRRWTWLKKILRRGRSKPQ
jgi:hypothetical protein